MQRRTLIRARDLAAFRDALASLALEGDPVAIRRRVIVVPSRASAELLRQTLEARALSSAGRAVILPELSTREDWLEGFRSAFPDAPPLASRVLREQLLARAGRAAAGRSRLGGSPFDLRPGLVAAMLDLYDELRRRQLTIRRFVHALFGALEGERGMDRGSESLIRQTSFVGLSFLGYERRLEARGAWDEHGLRRRLLSDPPSLPYPHVIVAVADHPADPKGLWPADFDLLGRLSAVSRIDVVVTDEVHDAGFRDRMERELPGITESRHEAPPSNPVVVRPSDADAVAWISRDREAELRDVARAIRARARNGAAGPELDGPTAIVFRRPLPYLYLVQQVLTDAHVPYQAFDALPLAAEPYAALVDLVMAAARTGGTRETVVELLRSSMLTFEHNDEPVRLPDAAALDAALADRRATGEADTYASVVDEYFADPETRRKERHGAARRAARAAAAIREELAPYRTGPASARIRTVTAFLRRHERPRPAEAPGADRHRRARAAILGILDALAEAHAGPEDAPDDPTPWIRHAIEARTFAPRRGTAGVHLVDAGAARFGEFDHVHLVGLVETDWPERPARSIFYTSGLLEPLGWTARRDHAAAELAAFRDLLALARRTTTLHAFRLEGDAIVARSPVIDLARDWPDVAAPASEPPRVFADEVLTATADVEGLDPRARAWLDGRRARPSLAVVRYRGHIDPLPARAYRVNKVERYATCPFLYFGESVLGLPEERAETEALTPLERGLLLHRLLEQFYRAWQERGGRAISGGNLDEAETLFETLVRRELETLPPGDRALEEARLIGSIVTPGLSRRIFDVELGGPDDVTERLIEVSLDGTYVFPQMSGWKQRSIEIRAKADRIDVFADGTLRVVDYKLGHAPDPDTTLQVAVYGHAARAWFEGRDGRPRKIREALYLAFGDEKEGKSSLRGEPTADDAVTARVSRFADAVDKIEAGEFPARPADVSRCANCGVRGVCRKEYWTDVDGPAESV